MPGILEQIQSRMRHASSGGGLLQGLGGGAGGGSGILSARMGILNSRLATLSAPGNIQTKIQNLVGTAGAGLRAPGGILSKIGAGAAAPAPAPSTDFRYAAAAQVAASQLPPPSSGRFT